MARVVRVRLDIDPLVRLLNESVAAVEQGAKQGLDDVKDKWVADAVNIAPLDKGALRVAIEGRVEDELSISVAGNARTKEGFNYGYYIHEGHMAADGKRLRHPGTVENFIDAAVNESKFERMIESAIHERLKGAGW